MTPSSASPCRQFTAVTVVNQRVSKDLLVLEIEAAEAVSFLPGQFAMLNFTGQQALVFSRPFSLLAVTGSRISFLYRVVGLGTARMAALTPGTPVVFLGPLGNPFPEPIAGRPTVLLAGGVGLPPLLAWWRRYGRGVDRAFFGARSGDDVPWGLLEPPWCVSVEHAGGIPADRRASIGLVTETCRHWLEESGEGGAIYQVLACGPLPMLRVAAALAAERNWTCLVSVEEHMGCGYGVCRGCIVPDRDGGHLTACQDGPVLEARRVDWESFTRGGA